MLHHEERAVERARDDSAAPPVLVDVPPRAAEGWTAMVRKYVNPRLARYSGPPCVVRNGLISPRCTEGSHFCGVPVWRSFPDVERRL